jgi:hypothetical protein
MKLPDEIYIVVVGYDGVHEDTKIPVALETYLDDRCSIVAAMAQLENHYGETRIAKLVFDECDLFVEQLESGKEFEKHAIDAFDAWF